MIIGKAAGPRLRNPTITERSVHWLREIVAGRDRLFADDDLLRGRRCEDRRPLGFAALMQHGMATRLGEERAVITDKGRAYLASLEAQ